jgi:hypothetical protein
MKYISLVVGVLFIVSLVSAIPTTEPATDIGNNNFTLSCSGAVGDTYIMWGPNQEQPIWKSTNSTAVAGSITVTIEGSPILPSHDYYAVACDASGCDATPISFTTTAYTPATVPTLGYVVRNMTASRFNLLYLPSWVIAPYVWNFPESAQQTASTIVFGIVLFFTWVGMWIRTRNVATGIIMGFLAGGMLMYQGVGLMLGIPVEFVMIAESLMYISLAGVFMMYLKK